MYVWREELRKQKLRSRWDSNPQPSVHWSDALGTLVVSNGQLFYNFAKDTVKFKFELKGIFVFTIILCSLI